MLAARAVERAATRLDDAADAAAATPAGLAAAAIDLQPVLEGAAIAGGVAKIVERRAAVADGAAQDVEDGGVQALPARRGQAPGRRCGMNPGAMQRLAGVDVPDTDHDRGIHEEVLHRFANASGAFGEIRDGEAGAERLGPEVPEARVAIELLARHHEQHAEAARIGVTQLAATCERQPHMRVRPERRSQRLERQPAAHPQMQNQHGGIGEVHEQVLRAPLEGFDAAADERRAQPGWYEPRAQPRLRNRHGRDRASEEYRLQAAPQSLDLGKLGHAVTSKKP